jgi:hypothetical protein
MVLGALNMAGGGDQAVHQLRDGSIDIRRAAALTKLPGLTVARAADNEPAKDWI